MSPALTATAAVRVAAVDVALRHGETAVAVAVQAARVVDRARRTVVAAVVSEVAARMLVVAMMLSVPRRVVPLMVPWRVVALVVWSGVAGEQDVTEVEHLERGEAPELVLEAVPEFPPGPRWRCREQRRAREHGQGDERPTSGPATCRVHGVSPLSTGVWFA
jgi:hypothetical protein